MLGVPREEAEHSLDLDEKARHVKQWLRRFVQDRKEAITVEVNRLQTAGFIREVTHLDWPANPILVKRKMENGEYVSTTPISTSTTPRIPFLFHASTRSLTLRPGAFYYLFLTATQDTIKSGIRRRLVGATTRTKGLFKMKASLFQSQLMCRWDGKEGTREARGPEFVSYEPHARVFHMKNRMTCDFSTGLVPVGVTNRYSHC